MIQNKKIYFCDFCNIEINIEPCKVYKANEITTCVLTAVEEKTNRTENGQPSTPLHMYHICLDCAIKLCKNGLSLVNGFTPPTEVEQKK